MTKAIEMIKNIIESYLWYDGEVYPIVDDTNQITYATTGIRMGNYSGNTNWLKLKTTYTYNGYTITLNPTAVDAIVVNAPVLEEIIIDYYSHVVDGSTQTEIAAALQASAYITTATAANGSGIVVADSDEGILRGGKFTVKRKEGGHISKHIHEVELYNIKCESDTEENVKEFINDLRRLSNNVNFFSYKWATANYPFWLKFGDADDMQNIGNNEFIITISLDARTML